MTATNKILSISKYLEYQMSRKALKKLDDLVADEINNYTDTGSQNNLNGAMILFLMASLMSLVVFMLLAYIISFRLFFKSYKVS